MVTRKDSLSVESISTGLKTQVVGRKIIHYPRLPSTMTAARQEARRRAPEGTVVVADEQTAGRGRRERRWLSPGGCLALSVVLYPGLAQLSSLIMIASLAVMHSIRAVTGLEPQIKWPNDVLANGKKVCGILVENDLKGKKVEYAVIGIGINVNIKVAEFSEIEPVATSLSDELGREVSRRDVLRRLLVELDRLYLQADETVFEEWRDNLVTLGKPVRVETGGRIYEGMAESVARDGSLTLRLTNGAMMTVVAGDVTLRHGQ